MRAAAVVTLLCLVPLPALAGKAPAQSSILVLPIDAKEGVNRDAAELVTVLLAGVVREVSPHRVVTYREIEGAVNQEMRLQIAGCDSVACAAEIAGALDADEILLGTLGKLGASVVLSASRVRARDATVLGSGVKQLRVVDDSEIADALPSLVAELFPERREEVWRRYPPNAARSIRAGAIRVEMGGRPEAEDAPSLLDPVRRPLRRVSTVASIAGGGLWALTALVGVMLLAFAATWVVTIGSGHRDDVFGAVNFQLLVYVQLASALAVVLAAPVLLVSVGFFVLGAAGLAGLLLSFA